MSTVQGGQGNIITNGLVLNLDAANPRSYDYPYNGTIWNDLSGNGNNGTLINGVGYNSSNGGSLVFDGVNDYVDVTDTPFRFSNTFSISCWFYWGGGNQLANIMGKRNDANPFNQYTLVFVESPYTGGVSNKLSFFARRDVNGSALNDIFLQYPLTNSGYYNVTATVSQLNQSLYVNGILRSSSSINTSTHTYNVSGKNLWIGGAFGSSAYFNGNIPSVQIYNRALSTSEVLQNYNATRARFGI